KRSVADWVEQNGSIAGCKMRDDRVRGALGNRARRFARGDLYWDRVRFQWSIEIIYLNEPEPGVIAIRGNGKLFDHLEIAEGSRLGAKPAGVADVIGQDFAFEVFSLAITKQDVQLGWRFDGGHNAFFRSALSVRWRVQSEPVISVWTQRDDVARFPDRPKQIAAKDFHRHVAGETRKIQLRRLREPRKICHHHHNLVFPLAKERQDFCI